MFFHIDEDAYGKLQRYLSAIKSSFQGVQGEDEIIADIETRIAELFNERITEPRQVIGIKELDEVIAIMGQPEDYAIDEEIFEDSAAASNTFSKEKTKKLYRDVDDAFLGGVSSGIGHYLNIDPLWIRLLWVGVVIAGFGSPLLIYILLWVLIPEANSTADKLEMKGKAVNIDNIQQKVKEGFENVADSVRNANISGNAKKGANSFFSALGAVVTTLLRIISKFFGIILIIIGATTVIGLFVTLITAGAIDMFDGVISGLPISNTSGLPLWLASLLLFFAAGIPFFFLFYLGIRIMSKNLKSLPNITKFGLLGLWIVSAIILGVFTAREVAATAYTGKVKNKYTLPIKAGDTLKITMKTSDIYDLPYRRSSSIQHDIDSNGDEITLSRNIRLIVRQTDEEKAYIQTIKKANGRGISAARANAEKSIYNYSFDKNKLALNNFFEWKKTGKYININDRNRSIQVILYLPQGTILYADANTQSFHLNDSSYNDTLDKGFEEEYLRMEQKDLVCISCKPNDSKTYLRDDNEEDNWSDNNNASINIITKDLVLVTFNQSVTKNDLKTLSKTLKKSKNIDLDYSQSTFDHKDRISKLRFKVNCNDGYEGNAYDYNRYELRTSKIGFIRDYKKEGKEAFAIGKLN